MQGTALGNYRVVSPLGEGSMGVVYVGRHDVLGQRVVIKVLRPELSTDAEMVRRFFNEAQAATAIRNPGIVQVFDFGTTPDGRAYIVMELLDGETLAARLVRRRHDAAECCRFGRQIANVLHAAHAAGITHRDLKPDNLFLVTDPEVIGGERLKVLDFGIAKLAGDVKPSRIKTRTGLIMGTPNYMAPEQCRSASLADARSDIYSLGCILFEIACGRPPFAFGGLGDIVAAHLYEPAPDPRQFAPQLPAKLAALILRMLAKLPDARPQTMAAVSQALDDIIGSLGPAPGAAPGHAGPAHPRPASVAPGAAVAPRAASGAELSSSGAPAYPAYPGGSGPASLHPAPGVMPHPAQAVMLIPAIALSPASGMPQQPTIQAWQTMPGAPSRPVSPRTLFAIGALVVVGATTAIIAVASGSHGRAPDRVAYDKLPRAAAPAVQPSAPRTVEPATPQVDPPSAHTAQTIEAECNTHLMAQDWPSLGTCADRLQPLDRDRADALATRAKEEARSAPHVAGVAAALTANDLKRARTELDQIWTESINRAAAQQSYDLAEAHAIDDLATQLARARHPDCVEYNQLVAQARATSPTRVTTQATARVTCTAKCDPEALAKQGAAEYQLNNLTRSLERYEAAYRCVPSAIMGQRALVIACNLPDATKARFYWKRLQPEERTQAAGSCARNGITADTLNSP